MKEQNAKWAFHIGIILIAKSRRTVRSSLSQSPVEPGSSSAARCYCHSSAQLWRGPTIRICHTDLHRHISPTWHCCPPRIQSTYRRPSCCSLKSIQSTLCKQDRKNKSRSRSIISLCLDAQKLMSTLEIPKLTEFFIRFIVHLNQLKFIKCY